MTEYADLARRLETALLATDARAVDAVVADAIAYGHDAADIYADVVTPAMAGVGRRWERAEVQIVDEHIATDLARRAVRSIGAGHARGEPRSRERVLLAGGEGEEHVLGLEMVSELLFGAGFDVYSAGANVPLEGVPWAISRLKPRLVALSLTMPRDHANLRRVLETIRAAHSSVGVIVGGQGIPYGMQREPLIAFLSDIRDLLPTADAMLERM